jgi:site-specific recombinase XerD
MKKSRKPLPRHLNDFLDWLDVEKGLSSKTQENYYRFIKKFFDWLKQGKLEDLKPHELTLDHVWQYRVFLSRKCLNPQGKPLKRSTQNYYLIALRSFLTFLSERNILSLSAEKIKLPKDKSKKQVRFLNWEQIEKLLSTPDTSRIQGLRDRAILETLFSTGMRIGELIALNKDQIKIKPETKDLELGIIGKGGRPRTVYFSERALFWLRKYLQTRKDKEKPLFINYQPRKGPSRRLSARSIEKMIKRYALVAGLPVTVTPHVIRHSFATYLLSRGVDMRTIQEFLGHKSIASTQIYAHVTSKRLRDIHRKFYGSKGS